jgi:signal transduction histidine kinase
MTEGIAFEPYFLKVELITVVLTFAVGILVHPTHMLSTLGVNLMYIGFCSFALGDDFPVSKFIFYTSFIICAGYFGHQIHKYSYRIYHELGQANQQISGQVKELEELNELRKEVLKIIGHDLRNPLSNIHQVVEYLEVEEDPAERKALFATLKSTTLASNQLLTDLMQWADIQTSQIKVKANALTVADLLQHVVDATSAQALAKQVVVEMKDEVRRQTHSDRQLLEVVLRNLLSNAVKFSSREGRVELTAKLDAHGGVVFEVRDTGIGMSATQIEAFNQHVRIGSKRGTEGEVGTGYGLHISRKLVEGLGGELHLTSEQGKGTTASIVLKSSLPKAS